MAYKSHFHLAAVLLAAAASLVAEPYRIEQKSDDPNAAQWQTANHFRIAFDSPASKGRALLVEIDLPAEFQPDSVRVIEQESGHLVPAKVEWRNPRARISWRSSGAKAYHIYFDEGTNGETQRVLEPAMVGAGDRISYGRPDVRAKLSVGLHPHPGALDFDQDGAIDLIVSCPDRPYNGIYLFRNLGSSAKPRFDRAEWLGPGKRDALVADFNGDGLPDLVTRGGYFSDVRRNRLSRWTPVGLPRDYHVGRDDLWYPVDWDHDGKIDLLAGVSDWREYGWDDAYNANGEWTNGPLHGYVYLHRNVGTNDKPVYAQPVRLQAAGKDIDLRGSPAPNPVDWLGRGRLDLIGGDFIDTVTIFENTGSRKEPKLAAGRLLEAGGKPIKMDLCMIQPRVVDWYGDGRLSLLVAEEDGRVALFQNTAAKGEPPELAPGKYLEQIDPYLKSGALSRPEAVDWNGDGKLDVVAGNSAGYVQYFENVGRGDNPAFADRGYLKAAGKTIRIMAGANLSIQGPAEAKWGYTAISVADWDVDGKLDLMLNSIIGEVAWYRNTGTSTSPELAAAQPVDVEWRGETPKPEWNWWHPKGKRLVTQWRTTPKVIDWNGDQLPDLVMLDHEGYLALFERYREDGQLKLRHPQRIFLDEKRQPLRLNEQRAGKSGRRKIDIADWDADGDLDLIVDSENAAWYENTGTQQRPVMGFRGNLVERKVPGHSPAPDVADWTGDGKLDLLIGAEDGFFYFFEREFIEERAAVADTTAAR